MKLYLLLPFLLFGFYQETDNVSDFKFKDGKGKVIDKSKLIKGKPLIVFYFDPNSQISADQAELIYYANEDFKEINTLWVSAGTHEQNLDFEEEFFSEYDWPLNIVCVDEKKDFEDWFGYNEPGTIYLYNKDWKFAGRFLKPQTSKRMIEKLK